MKKKVFCVLLSIVMTAVLVAGCQAESAKNRATGSKESKYKEFITVDVYDEFANYQGIQSGWFAKVVKDKFNMELNIIAPNVTGGGDTLYQTRSATGNLGDLILVNTANGKLNELVEAGLVMDCTELVKDKDLVKNYGIAIAKTNELVETEGIYGFPNSVSAKSATEPSEGLNPTFGPYIPAFYSNPSGYMADRKSVV